MNAAIPLLPSIGLHGMGSDTFAIFNILIELTNVTNKLTEIFTDNRNCQSSFKIFQRPE
jgi:hypothetical protein